VWNKPVRTDIIFRGKHTQSQTRLGRFKRWDNVEDLFFVKDSICDYKHIALIDDVITTGSTLESIMHSIRKISPDIKISVISLAVAK
jgi:predicted amidophosphoribosyltransferase